MLNRTEEAIVAYSESLKYESKNKGLFYYERSKTYHGLNKINEAKADLQQAINIGFAGVEPAYRQQLGL